jgi:hypothetical protein
VVIQNPPKEKEEEELPRKKTSKTTRVMNLLGGVDRMVSFFPGMEPNEAKQLLRRLENWLEEVWFKNHSKSPSSKKVVDVFVGEVLDTLKNWNKWERFLKPLDERTNRIEAAALLGCALCSAPAPGYYCGAGCKMRYCGQDCADAHWAEHNCRN